MTEDISDLTQICDWTTISPNTRQGILFGLRVAAMVAEQGSKFGLSAEQMISVAYEILKDRVNDPVY